MAVSAVLILLNKQIMSTFGFRFPMCLSGMGMAFSSLAAFLCCRVLRLVEPRAPMSARRWARAVLPVGLFMALTLHLGNLAYLYLSVSLIQMLKAFTPVITMGMLRLFQVESVSRELACCVLVITAGTLGASLGGTGPLSLFGLAAMLASEVAEALRLVLTQKLLRSARFHPVEGLMYFAPACVFWLALGALVFEAPRLRAEGGLAAVAAHPAHFAAAAVMGFSVNALAYAVIVTSSSLTLKVAGAVKNSLVAYCGVLFFGESVSSTQLVGYAVSLAGFTWYNKVKLRGAAAAVPSSGGDRDVEAGSDPPTLSRGAAAGSLPPVAPWSLGSLARSSPTNRA